MSDNGVKKVFVSFSSKDGFAGKVVDVLERQGARCFYAPRDIREGRSYPQEIIAELRTGALSNIAERSGRAQDAEDVADLLDADPSDEFDRAAGRQRDRRTFRGRERERFVVRHAGQCDVQHLRRNVPSVQCPWRHDGNARPKRAVQYLRNGCFRRDERVPLLC